MSNTFNFNAIRPPVLSEADRLRFRDALASRWQALSPEQRERIGADLSERHGAYAGDTALNDAVWIDEAEEIPPAFLGQESVADDGRWRVTWHALPCIPDTAPAPVIDWMDQRRKPLALVIFRWVVIVAVVATAIALVLR